MHRFNVPFGAALAICLGTAACAAPTNHEMVASPAPPAEIEESLALSVDAIDVRHGSLRIEATMEDGSPDVSMWLGPACETREVGRGIASRSGFAWSLSRDEVARAIECSLVVRVRAIDEDGRRLRRTATLDVGTALVADTAENVRLFRQEPRGAATKMSFLAARRASRLHVAGTVIGAEADEYSPRRGYYVSAFTVGNDDLARSVLGRKPLTLLGEHFLTTITIGSATLDVSEPQPEVFGASGELAGDG